MNHFDAKWQRGAARAREAAPRDTTMPHGFTARVLAAAGAPASPAWEPVWCRLSLGWLAGALAALAICALLELPHLRETPPLDPGVENTVAQLIWRL